MPAKSKQQQKFMGMVHALNKGDIKPSDVSKSVRDVAKNIKKSDAEDFASTKHSGLPRKVKEQILNAFKEYANKMAGNKHGGSGSYGYAPQKGLRDDDGYENESVNEAKFYITRNLGKGQGKSLVGGWDFKRDKKLPPKVFRTYKDAEKEIEKLSRGGSIPGNPTAYFVTDKDMNMVDKKGKRKRMFEGMFSTIDQIKQDSKDVRDFVKNVFKDRDFVKMKNDKEFIKYLKSIYESKGVPQNYMQGRTSDYHTALRGKNRDYSGGTNFKKNNHGQPDIEKDAEDQETNQLSVQQSKLKEEMGKLTSSERIELYKLYSKAMKAMPGSPNQKKIKVLINKLRKKADLKPLPEYGQRLDLSYLEDEEARLKGTPKPKDAINRDLDEGTMIRLAGQIAQELLPKDTWSRFSNDGKKNKEFVKSVVKDLAQTLNRFYKSHNISVRIKENKIELDEIGVFPITSYMKGIIPADFVNTTTRDKKERLKSTLRDLKNTLNHFWKQHKIPYRVK